MVVSRPNLRKRGATIRLAPTRCILALSALALLSGCETKPRGDRPRPVVSVAAPTKAETWMAVATPADAQRLANVTGAWAAGLADARKAGFVTAVKEEGDLLDTDAGLSRPDPTPGSYNCRLIRLGSTGKGKPALEKFKPFFCYVEVDGDQLTIYGFSDLKKPSALWKSDVLSGGIVAVAVGDTDGDGAPDVVFAARLLGATRTDVWIVR